MSDGSVDLGNSALLLNVVNLHKNFALKGGACLCRWIQKMQRSLEQTTPKIKTMPCHSSNTKTWSNENIRNLSCHAGG
eukprot:4696643-Amphidinium_carterae.1